MPNKKAGKKIPRTAKTASKNHPVYPPLEDSVLLAGVVRKLATGKVLDVGCGSGIQGATALKNKAVTSLLGVDINPAAINHCKKAVKVPSGRGKKAKITFLLSDLFANVPKTHFDTILFNPPYLPDDGFPHDPAVIGGKKGWETVARFLAAAPNYLNDTGSILLLFTSRTDKDKVHQLIRDAMLQWSMAATNTIAAEVYYVYALRKSQALIEAQRRGVTNIMFLAKGKRGLVYKGRMRGKDVALKVMNPSSTANEVVKKEATWLKRVNTLGIGPKLFFSSQCEQSSHAHGKRFPVAENSICMAFVPGLPIGKWAANASRPKLLSVIRDVLEQCRALDEAGVQKEEMQHPDKHVIIGKGKHSVTLIDFERMHVMQRPHNVTQFCSHIAVLNRKHNLKLDETALRAAAMDYSRMMDERMFKRVVSCVR